MQAPTRRLQTCLATAMLWVVGAVAAHGQDPTLDMRFRAVRASQDPLLVAEEVFQATVTAVEDGDSLVVGSQTGSTTIHLAGVDAPEMSQPGGPEAKAFLNDLVLHKTVTVRLQSAAERLARLEVNGSDVSAALVRGGMAWHCRRYTDDRELTTAEADARATKRGLWAGSRPTPPWQHRGVDACWQQKKAGS